MKDTGKLYMDDVLLYIWTDQTERNLELSLHITIIALPLPFLRRQNLIGLTLT